MRLLAVSFFFVYDWRTLSRVILILLDRCCHDRIPTVPACNDQITIFVLVLAPSCRGSISCREEMSDRPKYTLMSYWLPGHGDVRFHTPTPVLRVFRAVQRWLSGVASRSTKPNSIWPTLPLKRVFSGIEHPENTPPHSSYLSEHEGSS